MSVATDLQAIRQTQEALSTDGVMPPGAADLIATFLSVADTRVRTAPVDLSTTYTNDFASMK